VPRYLITTADERFWKFDRPVLFLGEWCRLYGRKSLWEAMDAVVAEPYGLDISARRRDLGIATVLFDELLPELAQALNAFHGVNHGQRYWNILIGHWLRLCISTTINRYGTICQVVQNYPIDNTMILEQETYDLSTPDILSFVYACSDSTWNYAFYARVLKSLGTIAHEINNDPSLEGRRFVRKQPSIPPQPKRLLKFLKQIAGQALSKFKKDNDSFIINSCLPLADELLVQLGLHQVPQLWQSPIMPVVVPIASRRALLNLGYEHHQGLGCFIRQIIPELIPSCYLEGYKILLDEVRQLPWPSKPKFILTAFNFFSDEIFKAWTAQKVEEGIPYFVNQHGNNYGTLIGFERWQEIETSDRFFTWGWSADKKKIVPAYVFRLSQRRLKYAPEGGLLLIELHPPYLFGTWDEYGEHIIYQEDQFRFVESLPEGIRNRTIVRLHAKYKNLDWADEERWNDRINVSIETGREPIRKLIEKSRLVVHSYDSTGILETLACNVPTIAFWRNGLDHLLPEARDAYRELMTVGILFVDDPEKAGAAIVRCWDNVSEWWNNPEVQLARSNFCEKYAHLCTTPVGTMVNLLRA